MRLRLLTLGAYQLATTPTTVDCPRCFLAAPRAFCVAAAVLAEILYDHVRHQMTTSKSHVDVLMVMYFAPNTVGR